MSKWYERLDADLASGSINKLTFELQCFRGNRTTEQGGLGAYRHLKNALNLAWKDIKWNDWLSWGLRSLCEYPVNAWTGCAAAGKTHTAGLFGFSFWLADPLRTSVILTSTTGKMVRKRIWPVIQELYHSLPLPCGNLLDSKTTLQATRGDDKHGIFALAVKEGNTAKALADIQGMHSPRMFLVIDEGTDAPEAIMEAVANLRKGCKDFRLLIIGNASSRLDPHGLLSEPKDGWGSVTVEDVEWETAGVPKWEIDPGIALHYDGTKSPNVRYGTDKWPFLLTNNDLRRAKAMPGADESVAFWKYTRGFWAPDGVCKTVLSELMVEKHGGRGKHTFLSKASRIAGLDPGFGGDNCVLRVGKIGDLLDGRMGIQLESTHYIAVKALLKEPIHYQIARQVREICNREGVEPTHFGLDSTGEGGGLADIISREWHPGINRIEFGGSPSDAAVSEEDPRPAKDAYDRRVTELWFNVRNLVISEQLKGLVNEDVKQFSSREFQDEKRKIKLDTKADCKKKIGHSPDEADAVAVLTAVARRLGVSAGGGSKAAGNTDWLEEARKKDDINVNDVEPQEDFNSLPVGEDMYELSEI